MANAKQRDPKNQHYSVAFQRAVRDAWACGEFSTDDELADAFGVSSRTILTWRNAAKPDGIAWKEVRRRFAEAQIDITAQALGETGTEMSLRQLRSLKAVQNSAMMFLFGRTFELADGTKVHLPQLGPQTFGEAVNCLVTAVKVERHIRGEPDIRVEYLHQFGEAVRRAFEEFAEQRGLAGDEETAAFAELLDRALEEALGPEGTALALRD